MEKRGPNFCLISQAARRQPAVSKTGHNTLLLPLSGVLCLESVMSDKICVCVCVCVCAPRVFKLGSQNRFLCIFCTFCSSRLALDLCTAALPSTASLPIPRFGWNQQTLTEHCWTRQAPSEHQLRMSGCLWCLFGRMCSGAIKNGLRGILHSHHKQDSLH